MHTLVIPGAKITDEGIRCLAAHNKKLVRLELFQVRLLCHSLCSACRASRLFSRLFALPTNTFCLVQSRNLNDDAVAELITSCSQMRYLDLAENPGLGRETAAAIAASCPKVRRTVSLFLCSPSTPLS